MFNQIKKILLKSNVKGKGVGNHELLLCMIAWGLTIFSIPKFQPVVNKINDPYFNNLFARNKKLFKLHYILAAGLTCMSVDRL